METDTQSEQGSRSSWFGRAGVAVAVAFFLYLLSTGPVWWLRKHGVISRPVYAAIYLPIGYFIENSPGDIFYRYISWWSPVIEM